MAEELTDVKNWPNVVFKAVLAFLASGIFILGTALFNKVDKATDTLILIGNRLDSAIKDFDYLRKDVTRLEGKVGTLENKVAEQEKENERIKAEIRRYHDR